MSYILHMSDFHLGRDNELEKSRLMELASWIKKAKIEVAYLVFTGDIVDAPLIQAECVKQLTTKYPALFGKLADADSPEKLLPVIWAEGRCCTDFYDKTLREVAEKHMKQAASLFQDFVREIGLNNQRVVLCCGNHDRLRLAGEGTFLCDTNKEKRFSEEWMDAPFAVYDVLCQTINPKLSHRTNHYSIGELTFLIANSNWRHPEHKESNQMCISCNTLFQKVEELENLESYDKKKTVFIAHKPYDDFCEEVKFPYHGKLLTLWQTIERTASAFLCGDKHSFAVKLDSTIQVFMCGKPLNSEGVRYNLIQWEKETGISSCSYILNDGQGWIKIPITDCIESVYDISRSHIKPYAFALLPGNSKVPRHWDCAIKSMEESCSSGQMTDFSRLFASFCDLKRDETHVDVDKDSIFAQIISLISGGSRQAFSIKGRPGAGKSTFTSLLYLNMLWMFYHGETRYTPFYFSLETILAEIKKKEEHIGTKEFVDMAQNKFKEYLQKCIELRNKYDLTICVFVDGLEKSRILTSDDGTIEKKIFQLLEKSLDREKDRYVMCFNTCDAYGLEPSFDNINSFDHVLFMNRVRILPYRQEEPMLDMFLTNYLKLLNEPTEPDRLKKIKAALAKLRTPSVDLFLLHHCRKHILSIKEEDVIWDVLQTHLKDLEKLANETFPNRIDTARETAGLLYSQRESYSELLTNCREDPPTIPEFYQIINGAGVADYLTASSYVNELTKFASTAESIPEDSILFSFLPNAIALLIRLLLDKKTTSANHTLGKFIKNHSKELKGYLYSTVVYLCGHLRTSGSARLVSQIPEPPSDSDDFFDLCNRRSYDLAKAVSSKDEFTVKQLILNLMDNDRYRWFNRSYQLHYYQDDPHSAGWNHDPWEQDMTASKGFDFRSSFLMLLSKLEPALNGKQSYPLMELDLFTICDLVYSRLQYVSPHGFFYAAKYNERANSRCVAVLSRTVELLKQYTRHHGGNHSMGARIDAYFSLMLKRLSGIQKKVTLNTGKDVSTPYVSLCYDFEKVRLLETTARVGWNINEAGTIKVEDQPYYGDSTKVGKRTKKSSPILESISQHVMESVYIAQLFLPEKLPKEPLYDKSRVISMILMAELGKASCKDYSPHYNNFNVLMPKETEALSHALVLGALDGYAVHPEFFRPLSVSPDGDINLLICWEIKMIQMEYKYYTLYNTLGFSQERRREFQNCFKEPRTGECRRIREQLILNNPNFQMHFDR